MTWKPLGKQEIISFYYHPYIMEMCQSTKPLGLDSIYWHSLVVPNNLYRNFLTFKSGKYYRKGGKMDSENLVQIYQLCKNHSWNVPGTYELILLEREKGKMTCLRSINRFFKFSLWNLKKKTTPLIVLRRVQLASGQRLQSPEKEWNGKVIFY